MTDAKDPTMRMAAVDANSTKTSVTHDCAGCGKRIGDRFLLKAVDLYWHEDCLKCGCCDCRLGEVGSTLYKKTNLLLCKRDYLRLFGTTGHCAACNKVIPAFEMVMRAKANVYHLECFACQQCNHRFCVGDRFYLCDNKILCEYDYEERMVFANMSYSSDSLAHIKRQQQPVEYGTCSRVSPMLSGGRSMSFPYQTNFCLPSVIGPSTSSGILQGGNPCPPPFVGDKGGPSSVAGTTNGADDASSGYGSPDSLTMDDR